MSKARQNRLFIVPAVLLAVVLVCMTLGSAWHHHTGSSDAACQICHLNHQPLDQAPEADRTPSLILAGATPDLLDSRFAPRIVVRQIPARAPPTA